ncbi:MAG TPA: DUF6069 family protein [Actinophytocola sp.]|nr:DUF6069 family protein [Actinophytocola sp.]
MSSTSAHRAATVIAAATAGLLGWLGLRAAGADLVADTTTVGAADVVVASLFAGAAAWVTVSLLGRYASRPRTAWVLLSTTVLSVSMLGPTYSAPALTAVALMGLHFVVGGVLVGGFASTLTYPCSVAESQEDGVVVR